MGDQRLFAFSLPKLLLVFFIYFNPTLKPASAALCFDACGDSGQVRVIRRQYNNLHCPSKMKMEEIVPRLKLLGASNESDGSPGG